MSKMIIIYFHNCKACPDPKSQKTKEVFQRHFRYVLIKGVKSFFQLQEIRYVENVC